MSTFLTKISNFNGQDTKEKLKDHLIAVDKDIDNLFKGNFLFHQFPIISLTNRTGLPSTTNYVADVCVTNGILYIATASGTPATWQIVGTQLNEYGNMTNDTGNAIAIGVAGTWYEVTSGWVTGLVNLVTFGGDHYLQVNNAGKYQVIFNVTLSGTAAGDKIGAAIAINGTVQTAGHAHSTVGNANDEVGLGGSNIFNLAANDQISLSVANHTFARNLNIIHSSVSLLRIL